MFGKLCALVPLVFRLVNFSKPLAYRSRHYCLIYCEVTLHCNINTLLLDVSVWHEILLKLETCWFYLYLLCQGRFPSQSVHVRTNYVLVPSLWFFCLCTCIHLLNIYIHICCIFCHNFAKSVRFSQF